MKTIKILAVLSISFLYLCFNGCTKNEAKEVPVLQTIQDTVPVTIMKLEPEDFIEFGEYYGKVSPIQEASIVCFAGGYVEELDAKEGNKVNGGQSLAKIDSKKATANLEIVLLNERLAKDSYERAKKHFSDGNASKVSVDQAHLAWLNSKAARIDAQKVHRGALCISPISGVIISRYIDLHQEISPGTSTFHVAQLYKMKIIIGIPENEIIGVKEGNIADVTVDIFTDRKWTGTISRISREVNPQTRTFTAEVYINNHDRALKPGLTAHVKLIRRVLKNQIVVSTNLIRTDGDDNFIMVADKNNTAAVYDVLVGASNATHSIIKKGLASGSTIIVKGNHLVSNGTPIKIFQ
ncbi:MAG: efflux RND transporter periplasmic adaptor subunit [Chitinispirillia bacterium]|jgi:RND family efflux transporter MFP subunit